LSRFTLFDSTEHLLNGVPGGNEDLAKDPVNMAADFSARMFGLAQLIARFLFPEQCQMNLLTIFPFDR
jgi:hypothetical protein